MESDTSTSDNTEFVLVTEPFYPATTSTVAQLMTDLAVGLQDRGLEMTVITRGEREQDNHPDALSPEQEGVDVRRMPIPELQGTSVLSRAINWIFFMVTVTLRLALDRPKTHREVIFLSHPPMLPVPLWIVCRIRGWEYTYIIYDFYPDAAVEMEYISKDGIVYSIWSWLNRQLLPDANHLVALGPEMRNQIIRHTRGKVHSEDVTIIHNWDDGDFIEPRSKEDNWFSKEHELDDVFTLVYSGNIGQFHDLETVVRAGSRLQNEDVRILIIGEGDNKESIGVLADELGVLGETVTILPYQPWKDVPYTLTSGDVTIVTIDEGFKGLNVSSKLYTSLAAGLPVLVISAPGDDEARIVETFDAGIHVSPDHISDAIAAIETWKADPQLVEQQGENARQAFEDHFSKDKSIDRYYDLLTGKDVPTAVPEGHQFIHEHSKESNA